MRGIVTLVLAAFMSCITVTAAAQSLCPEDDIETAVRQDSILVTHRHAQRNCCAELALAFDVEAEFIDFFEDETGELCDCTCCFDLHYSACGFEPGHYTVRFWNGDGTIFHGSTEVEIGGTGQSPEIVSTEQGKCVGPMPTTISTWSIVKRLFR